MERSFLDYAMSVIISRALPDVRDGLKPVHRRILWDMETQGFRPDRPFVKCARVTGDTMAKYHPHGELGHLRRPGAHGPALLAAPPAHRLPRQLRLARLRRRRRALHRVPAVARWPCACSTGIDENTVDFIAELRRHHPGAGRAAGPLPEPAGQRQPGHRRGHGHQHPAPQPGRGHRRHRPPHRPPRRHPRRPDAVRQGPRLPHRRPHPRPGRDHGRLPHRVGARSRCGPRPRSRRPASAATASRSWSASCPTRCRRNAVARPHQGPRRQPATSTASPTPTTIRRPAWTPGWSSTLKRDANANVVLNNLFKLTQLQTSFPVNMVALVDGVPRTLNLVAGARGLHRATRSRSSPARSEFRLDQGPRAGPRRSRACCEALDIIDADHRPHPGQRRPGHGPRRPDGGAVLVQRGAGRTTSSTCASCSSPACPASDLEDELAGLRQTIAELEAILADEGRKREVIKEELAEVREAFATPRLAQLTHDTGEMSTEDLIDDKELVVVMTGAGYVKTVDADAFRAVRRGAKGVAGTRLREDDLVSHLVYTTAHAYLLFFSNRGKVYRLRAHEIPERERAAKGLPIVNLLPLAPDEHIQAIIDTREFGTERFLFFATKKGVGEEDGRSTSTTRRGATGSSPSTCATATSWCGSSSPTAPTTSSWSSRLGHDDPLREADVRAMGRAASGVRGMKLPRRRRGRRRSTWPATTTSILHGHRVGLRQAHAARPVQPPGPRRPGRASASSSPPARAASSRPSWSGSRTRSWSSPRAAPPCARPVRDISSQGRDATGVRVMNLEAGQVVAAVAPILATNGDDD